jgi:hypothetical protein
LAEERFDLIKACRQGAARRRPAFARCQGIRVTAANHVRPAPHSRIRSIFGGEATAGTKIFARIPSRMAA